MKWFAVLFLLSAIALSDTINSTVKIKGGTDGTTIGNTGDALNVVGTVTTTPSGTQNVNVTNASIPVTGTFFQATQPVSGSLGRTWSLLNTTDSVNVGNFPATQAVTQSGTWNVGLNAGSNTIGKVDQGVGGLSAWKVDGSGVTQPVSGTVTANAGTNLNTSALALSATQTNGTQKTQRVDGSGNVTPAGDIGSREIFVGLSDGANLYDARQVRALTSGTDTVSVTSALDRNVTGTINAVNQSLVVSTAGMSSVFVSTSGTWVGSLAFQIQAGDGSWVGTYGALPFSTLLGNFVGNGQISIPVGGVSQFRIFSNAWTSGTATVTINAGSGSQAVQVHNLTPGNLQVVANAGTNLNTSALALDTSVSGLQVSQGSTTSGQKGSLMQGAVSTDVPTYSNGQTSPLSLSLRGGLRSKIIGLDSSITPIRNDYSSNNVTTSAYFQLTASTANVINRLYVFDSSGQDFVLATGGAGSEVDQIEIPPGGWDAPVDLYIPSGTRLSIKSKSATASSGILLITGLK